MPAFCDRHCLPRGKGNELARLLKRLEALGEDKVYEAARMALQWEMKVF